MAGSGKRVLREHLKSLSPAECRELVLELWNRFPEVRDYFESRFSPDQGRAVLERAKSKIAREFGLTDRLETVGLRSTHCLTRGTNRDAVRFPL